MNSSNLVWGATDDSKLGDASVGTLIYESLRKKTQTEIIMVEANTGEQISRGKLLESVIKLTVILQKLGISKADTVGIITPNTWKFPVPALATLFMGATVSPINPTSFKDDFHHYLNLSKPKIIFVSHSVLDKIRELKREMNFLKYVVVLDSEDVQNGELAFDELLRREVDYKTFQIHKDIETDAFLLYSSGTTGLPKGVVLTQKNVLNAMKYCCHTEFLDVNEDCVMQGILPLFHIFGLVLLFVNTWSGKRIIFLQKFHPDTFLKTIQDYKVTYLSVVPPLLLFLAKSPLVDKYDISSLTHVFCGAAPLGKEMERIAFQRLKIGIRQLYGLSECAAITIMPRNGYKSGSVGKVVMGHHAKIIDPDTGKILGRNKNGEICFKGPCVMKGYKNNEEETRKTVDKDGYLHTGDIGYFDDDGYLYILDRLKELIKYKGFQVPPAQLEDILMKHPAVKDVAVIGRPDERSGELPTAFIALHSGAQVTEQEIIDYVAERVSVEKQLHGGVIFKDEIPRTTSGKILRKELRKLLL